MIDILLEETFSLTEATKRLPCRRKGKRPNVATLYRWAQVGCRGIRLETLCVGATRCTSMEALQRFFDALTAQSEHRPTPQPPRQTRQLRRQVSMTRVLGLIGYRAAGRRGPQLRGQCPICRSPDAFSVHLSRQIYHCFACHSHGNVLDLWAAVHGQSLYHAAVDLCRTIGLVLPARPVPMTRPMPQSQQTSEVAVRVPQRNR